jgi:hypothetical protein
MEQGVVSKSSKGLFTLTSSILQLPPLKPLQALGERTPAEILVFVPSYDFVCVSTRKLKVGQEPVREQEGGVA